MDIQMPDMDGIETTQHLRAQFGSLPPIVAMTAYSMKEDRERFLSQGMDDYVAKPIRAKILIDKVKELVLTNEQKTDDSPTVEPENTLPVIDLDIVAQLSQLGGMELVESIFEDFVVESTELVNEALAAFEAGNIAVVKSNMHTIKGSAGTIGVIRVAEIARIGEAKLKENDTSTLATDLQVLKQEFDTFLADYQAILQGFSEG
jgi:response regulator RpfG family c-di-GMP phosphodiesterase